MLFCQTSRADPIFDFTDSLTAKQVVERVAKVIGRTPTSSVRSYLRLNTPDLFVREERGVYRARSEFSGGIQLKLASSEKWKEPILFGASRLFHADCFDWLERQDDNSVSSFPLYAIFNSFRIFSATHCRISV